MEEGLLRKKTRMGGGEETAAAETYEEAMARLTALSEAWRKRAAESVKRRRRWRLRKEEEEEEGAVAWWLRWRKRTASALESTAAHATVLALLLIDLLATCIDILHTLHDKSRDLTSCLSLLRSCSCSFTSPSPPLPHAPIWGKAFSWVSLAVLCSLLAYLASLALALGPFPFFSNPGYALDTLVLLTAVFLELFLDTRAAGLLVILNLWRIIRVAHGVFEFTDEAWEKNVESLQARIKSMDDAHRRDLRFLQQRVRDLEQELQRRGTPPPQ